MSAVPIGGLDSDVANLDRLGQNLEVGIAQRPEPEQRVLANGFGEFDRPRRVQVVEVDVPARPNARTFCRGTSARGQFGDFCGPMVG